MSETRTSRLRFGIRSLLILVAVVAGVFFYLRNGPLLAKSREVVWVSTSTQERTVPQGYSLGIPNQSSIVLRYDWHPWTSWRRGGKVQVRLHLLSDQPNPFPSRQLVGKSVSTHALGMRFFGGSTPLQEGVGPETDLTWNRNWGNPELVIDEFTKDKHVPAWTPEAFLEWIGEREEK